MRVLLFGSYTRRSYREATEEEIERMLSAPRVDHRCCPPGSSPDVFVAPSADDEAFWSAWHARHPADPVPLDDIIADAGKLGTDAGKIAASWLFDGTTPEETYRHMLRGIDEGDPLILDTCEPPSLASGGDYTETGLADDLGIEPGDQAPPDAVTAWLDAASDAFWHEVERIAREHLDRPDP